MNFGELLARLRELPADYPVHAEVVIVNEVGDRVVLTKVDWRDREFHAFAPDDTGHQVWLYTNDD